MAPYYSMEELAVYHYPFIPDFLVSYEFRTHDYLPKVRIPVLIGHGKNDGTIPSSCSVRLKRLVRKDGKLVLLENTGHNDVQSNEVFQQEVKRFLMLDF